MDSGSGAFVVHDPTHSTLAKESVFSMKRLLFATDLSPRSDRAMDRALDLMAGDDARLSILYVIDEDLPANAIEPLRREAVKAIESRLNCLSAPLKGRISFRIETGTPEMRILEVAEEEAAELIIAGTHRKDFLGDLFLGTTVERVIRYGEGPVLVVRDRFQAPYRRILVGTDFSVHSRRALEFALQMVPQGTFHLLHAFDVPYGGFLTGQDVRQQTAENHRQQMDRMLGEELTAFLATLRSPAPEIEPILRQGSVQEVIMQQIEELHPDLLVVGTHGRTGIAHAFLGSVAEGLLSSPPCDVLAFKAW